MKDEHQIKQEISNTILFDKYDDYNRGYKKALEWVLQDEEGTNDNFEEKV